MDLSMRAVTVQRLEQRVSPQFLQALSLLQGPPQDLVEAVDAAVRENCALEYVEEGPQEAGPAGPDDLEDASALRGAMERLQREWEELGPSPRYGGEEDRKHAALQAQPSSGAGLQEVLERELIGVRLVERERQICLSLIAAIDSRGYLGCVLDEAFAASVSVNPACSVEDAEACLEFLQTIAEPPGVGARDLRECLLLQLEAGNEHHERDLELALVREHFEDLLENRLQRIADALGERVEDVQDAATCVAALDMEPGRVYSSGQAVRVIPDVVVEWIDGELVVRVEDDWLPRVRLSPRYLTMLQQSDGDPAVLRYVRRKVKAARGFLQAIVQRQSTLQRVAEAIMRHQREFVRDGLEALRPLLMQSIADEVGVHVSTISRAVMGKYAQTPQGVFALRYFFTAGVPRVDGASRSRRVVIKRLAELIAAEDKRRPSSDERLTQQLRQEGWLLERRTVSKYRKELGIPSTRLRKSFA